MRVYINVQNKEMDVGSLFLHPTVSYLLLFVFHLLPHLAITDLWKHCEALPMDVSLTFHSFRKTEKIQNNQKHAVLRYYVCYAVTRVTLLHVHVRASR